MNRKPFLCISLIALSALILSVSGPAVVSPAAAGALTGYYNLFGHEGIGTVGASLVSGQTPPVGDFVPNGCRYINVPNATYGQYYLRYPLHLPNGVTITTVSAFVADFNLNGTMFVHMKSRPWNSRGEANDFAGSIGTSSGAAGDQTISRTGITTVVNNETTEYWIDVIPENSADPGQMCVYGIQVTYTYNGAFLPLIQR